MDGEVKNDGVNAQRGRVSKAQDHTINAFAALPADERKYWKQRAEEGTSSKGNVKVRTKKNQIPVYLTDLL